MGERLVKVEVRRWAAIRDWASGESWAWRLIGFVGVVR